LGELKMSIENIIKWGKARNMYEESTPLKQFEKYLGEKGEVSEAISKNKLENVKDEIGDCIVCLTNVGYFFGIRGFDVTHKYTAQSNLIARVELDMLTEHLFNAINVGDIAEIIEELAVAYGVLRFIAEDFGFTIEDCINTAYKKIEHRKGKFINGSYVKESDL
jgi:NTP pyrophosphatase (non-canonical NTP hydrolase)